MKNIKRILTCYLICLLIWPLTLLYAQSHIQEQKSRSGSRVEKNYQQPGLEADTTSVLSRGTTEIVDGRLKIQFGMYKDQAGGAFQLRSILEEDGFKNEDGFVRTRNALAPLELYNYLYEDGNFIFTIFLPFDSKAFMTYSNNGFLTFKGEAAEKLFTVVKKHLRPHFTQLLEQYVWGKDSYCDKTIQEPASYRCFISWLR